MNFAHSGGISYHGFGAGPTSVFHLSAMPQSLTFGSDVNSPGNVPTTTDSHHHHHRSPFAIHQLLGLGPPETAASTRVGSAGGGHSISHPSPPAPTISNNLCHPLSRVEGYIPSFGSSGGLKVGSGMRFGHRSPWHCFADSQSTLQTAAVAAAAVHGFSAWRQNLLAFSAGGGSHHSRHPSQGHTPSLPSDSFLRLGPCRPSVLPSHKDSSDLNNTGRNLNNTGRVLNNTGRDLNNTGRDLKNKRRDLNKRPKGKGWNNTGGDLNTTDMNLNSTDRNLNIQVGLSGLK